MSEHQPDLEGDRILVTGGAGFIGSHLVDSLAPRNGVTVVDDLSTADGSAIRDDCEFRELDIRDRDALAEVYDDVSPDVVFHLAADAHTRATSAGWDDPAHDMDVNALGTQNLFEIARESDADPVVVYASSCALYGNPEYTPMDESHPIKPISPYGVHKLVGDRYVYAYASEHDLRTRAVRIFNTYGPRQPRYVMYDFLKKLQDDNDTLEVLGSGRQVRDYTYIDDAVDAFELVATNGQDGEAYNMSGNQTISIGDLAELMIDLLDLDAEVEYTGSSWKGDPKELVADTAKLEDIGFDPDYSIEEGLENLVEWFEETEGPVAASTRTSALD